MIIISVFQESNEKRFHDSSCTSLVFVQLKALSGEYVPPLGACLALEWRLVFRIQAWAKMTEKKKQNC